MQKDIARVIITMGDPAGIGPEIICKAFGGGTRLFDACVPVVVGDLSVLEKHLHKSRVKFSIFTGRKLTELPSRTLNIIDLKTMPSAPAPGKISKTCGLASITYVDYALRLLEKEKAALVTAPVSKEAIVRAGVSFEGHTEYLARRCGPGNTAMVFVSGKANVLLVTRHLPLKDVPVKLSKKMIVGQVETALKTLKQISGVSKIFICGLNPHCGENGIFGGEENAVIKPAVKSLHEAGINIKGPMPADWVFYRGLSNIPPGSLIVCLYHDQAMIPLKAIFGLKLVNLTCGLKFLRTSPAHGTAFDIAGKNLADPQSMVEAVRFAANPTTYR